MKIVLLPGLDGTGLLFKPFLEALPQGTETQIVSYPMDRPLGYRELTDLVAGKLPKEKYVLLGESFSGYIACQIARQRPKPLQAVIFVGAFLDNPRPLLLALAGRLPMDRLLSAPIPDFIVKRYLLGQNADQNLTALVTDCLRQVSPQVLATRLQEIARLNSSLQCCDLASHYIQADADRLVPKSCLESFKKVFDNLHVHEIPGGHLILQSNPTACAKVVNDVIARA